MKKKELWQAVLAELQLSLSPANFSAWFSQTTVAAIEKEGDKQIIRLEVANPYVKNTIESRYQKKIKKTLDRLTKKENQLKIIIRPKKNTSLENSGPLFRFDYKKEKKQALKKALAGCRLRPGFTFENFAVSSPNEMAYAAAQAVAKRPGRAYNLLFLYGGVGVGKTHLTQAIGHEILKKNPYASIVYCTSEEFTNEIVEAIQAKSTQKFRKKYRSAKALLIDDVQFIGGKETIQEEFFHTFNTIQAEGGQVVLTSDCLPSEIKGLEARLRSRFEGGLTIDVQEPNFELRTAILLIKSKQQGIPLPMDVAQLIANQIKSTRRLEGFLIRLITESKTRKKPINPEMCRLLLEEVAGSVAEVKKTVKPKEIVQAVASYFNLRVSQLKGSRRTKTIVVPRQIAMYLIRKELKTPLMEIGALFGGRDHTTVMHSVEKITNLVSVSEELRFDVSSLKKRVYHSS